MLQNLPHALENWQLDEPLSLGKHTDEDEDMKPWDEVDRVFPVSPISSSPDLKV